MSSYPNLRARFPREKPGRWSDENDDNDARSCAGCRQFVVDCIAIAVQQNLTEFVRSLFYLLLCRGLLRWAALFLGELRDGLTMINMQSAFLIVSKVSPPLGMKWLP